MPASLVRLADLLDGDVPQIEEAPSFSDYTRELVSRGHRVSLFTLTPHVRETKHFIGPSLQVWLLPLRHGKRTGDLYGAEIKAVKDAYRNCGALDILHTHWLHEYTAAAFAFDLPHLVTAHDAPWPIARYQRPLPFWTVRAAFASAMLMRVKSLAVLSPYLAGYYRKYHLYRNELHVVPEFTAPAAYAHASEADTADRVDLTFAAVLNGYNRRKNSDTLISAFSDYRKSFPSAKLILFGHGHGPYQEAEQWARGLNLCENIEFAGATRNDILLSRISREVDVVIHPALEEAFGIAVADAMAMAKPVIGGRGCGAIPWVLGDGKAGLVVDVRKREAIADAMTYLTRQPHERRRLGEAASRHARENFHISKVADRYLEIYAARIESHPQS